MPARPSWRGQIKLALVSIPVEIYPATKAGKSIAFHQVHEPSGQRVRYEKVVPGIGPVDRDDILKGYEVEKGEYVLLDPEEMAEAFARFVTALREGLGLGPAKGVVAVDGKRLRRGYERGRAFMPPLMVSVWDAETRLSLATRHALGGNEVAATLTALKSLVVKGCIVTGDALHSHPGMAAEVRELADRAGVDGVVLLPLAGGPSAESELRALIP